jgi:hypothetical protein
MRKDLERLLLFFGYGFLVFMLFLVIVGIINFVVPVE